MQPLGLSRPSGFGLRGQIFARESARAIRHLRAAWDGLRAESFVRPGARREMPVRPGPSCLLRGVLSHPSCCSGILPSRATAERLFRTRRRYGAVVDPLRVTSMRQVWQLSSTRQLDSHRPRRCFYGELRGSQGRGFLSLSLYIYIYIFNTVLYIHVCIIILIWYYIFEHPSSWGLERAKNWK